MYNKEKDVWPIRVAASTRKGIKMFAKLHGKPIGYMIDVMFRNMAGMPPITYDEWKEMD